MQTTNLRVCGTSHVSFGLSTMPNSPTSIGSEAIYYNNSVKCDQWTWHLLSLLRITDFGWTSTFWFTLTTTGICGFTIEKGLQCYDLACIWISNTITGIDMTGSIQK